MRGDREVIISYKRLLQGCEDLARQLQCPHVNSTIVGTENLGGRYTTYITNCKDCGTAWGSDPQLLQKLISIGIIVKI